MANPRNVGGIRARSGRRRRLPVANEKLRVNPDHYLTAREAADIGRKVRQKDESRGIFHRWNDRKSTPAEAARIRRWKRRQRRKPQA